jgi:hypothetical protein
MSKMQAFAITAVLILAAVGGWAASTIGARTATFTTQTSSQIDTLQAMSTAKDLPTAQYGALY